MNTANIAPLKAILEDKLFMHYGTLRGEPMNKADFLHDLWSALGSFVHHNKQNSLIQNAVYKLEHGDLIPRTFLILSVLYGSYGHEPDRVGILKDFINMLDKDLDEEELRICEYAQGKSDAFFPELSRVWIHIREIYGAAEFDLAVLPPTPYYAYSLLVLNRRQFVLGNINLATMFGALSILYHQMQNVLKCTQPKLTIVK